MMRTTCSSGSPTTATCTVPLCRSTIRCTCAGTARQYGQATPASRAPKARSHRSSLTTRCRGTRRAGRCSCCSTRLASSVAATTSRHSSLRIVAGCVALMYKTTTPSIATTHSLAQACSCTSNSSSTAHSTQARWSAHALGMWISWLHPTTQYVRTSINSGSRQQQASSRALTAMCLQQMTSIRL